MPDEPTEKEIAECIRRTHEAFAEPLVEYDEREVYDADGDVSAVIRIARRKKIKSP